MSDDPKNSAEAARQARLAAALRANLARRKARDRAIPPGAPAPAVPPERFEP